MKRIKTTTVCKVIITVVALFMFLGCAGMSTTEQRVLSGGAIGAGAGAAIGAVSGGSVGTGAVVGGAAGAAGGYLYDKSKQRSFEIRPDPVIK